jgi:hypothetical protein
VAFEETPGQIVAGCARQLNISEEFSTKIVKLGLRDPSEVAITDEAKTPQRLAHLLDPLRVATRLDADTTPATPNARSSSGARNTTENGRTAVWAIGRRKNTPKPAQNSPAGWPPHAAVQ